MLLKVGELAKRTGITVRTLHHYDSIGLLRPSARSEGGYRLYNRDDVSRLHGIQTLRRMGLTLADVAQLLEGSGASLPAILARQIGALERDMAQSQALHERLSVMQMVLVGGGQPDIDDWLASLSIMSTLEQYFSAGELKLVFARWRQCEAEWPPLVHAVRDAMVRRVPTDALELQRLARRWMDVSARWMNGDTELLKRWGHMVRELPGLRLPSGMDRELLDCIDAAIQLRLATLAKYITTDEFQRLDKTLGPEWRALSDQAERLMADGLPPQAPAARRLASEWRGLLDRMARHDAALREKLVTAFENEPILQAGADDTPQVRHYLRQASA